MTDLTAINNDSNGFKAALENNEVLDCYNDNEGNTFYYRVNWFMRIVYIILPFMDNFRAARVTKAFNDVMDIFEKDAAKFKESFLTNQIDAGKALKKHFKAYTNSSVRNEMANLTHRIAGIAHRHGIAPKKPFMHEEFTKQLGEAVLEWKQTNLLIDNKTLLTDSDNLAIQNLLALPNITKAMVKLLLKPGTEFQIKIFKAIFRDKLSPEVVMGFPATVNRIHNGLLQHAIGMYNLARSETIDGVKQLTLPIAGERVSILDKDTKINFGKPLQGPVSGVHPRYKGKEDQDIILTIQQIFDDFADRRYSWGLDEIDILPTGIQLYSSIRLDRNKKQEINLPIDTYFKNAAPVEILTSKEAIDRYGFECVNGRWGVREMSTREQKGLGAKGTHNYFEIAVPNNDGNYHVYTLGKTSPYLPRTAMDHVFVIAETLEGVICMPDPCRHAPNREHRGYAAVISPEKAKLVMMQIQRVIQKGLDGHISYQLFGVSSNHSDLENGNCSDFNYSIRKIINAEMADESFKSEKIPEDLNTVDWLDSEPDGFFGYIYAIFKYAPRWLHNLFCDFVAWILGGGKGREVVLDDGTREMRTLLGNRPWDIAHNGHFKIPAKYNLNHEQGTHIHQDKLHYGKTQRDRLETVA